MTEKVNNSGCFNKLLFIIIAVLVIGLVGLISFGGSGYMYNDEYIQEGSGPIAYVEVTGVINSIMADDIINHIEYFTKLSSIKGMLLRVNSPGGGVVASQEIYYALERFKEKGKKLYISMGDLAASGGYYVSVPGDKIFANPGTITGSIGVIINFLKYKELMNKIGIDFRTIKSADLKDIGSPYRDMSQEERNILTETVKDVFQQFLDAIEKHRSSEFESIEKYADGRIVSGRQAKDFGLVDELGDEYTALQELKKELNIIEDIKPVRRYKKEKFDLMKRLLGVKITDYIPELGTDLLQYRMSN